MKFKMPHRTMRLRFASESRLLNYFIFMNSLGFLISGSAGQNFNNNPNLVQRVQFICKDPSCFEKDNSNNPLNSPTTQKRSPVYGKSQNASISDEPSLSPNEFFNRKLRHVFRTLPEHLVSSNRSSQNLNSNQYFSVPQQVMTNRPQLQLAAQESQIQQHYAQVPQDFNQGTQPQFNHQVNSQQFTQETQQQFNQVNSQQFTQETQQQFNQVNSQQFTQETQQQFNQVNQQQFNQVNHQQKEQLVQLPQNQYSNQNFLNFPNYVQESSPVIQNSPYNQNFPKISHYNPTAPSDSDYDANKLKNEFSFDSIMNEIYPNGTVDAETHTYTEIDQHEADDIESDVEHNDHDRPYPETHGLFDKLTKLDINFETSELKLTIGIVVLWYLILVVLISSSGFAHSTSCDGPSPHEFPLFHTKGLTEPVLFAPHGDSALQEEMYNMFTSHDGDSREEIDMPDLSPISSMCSKEDFFYGLNSNHMKAVEMVKDILMGMQGPTEVMMMAKGLRHSPHIHPKVWYEAMTKTHFEREDMGGMLMPGPLDAMPDTFIPGESLEKGFRSLRSIARSGSRGRKGGKKEKQKCVRVDGRVGKDNGPNNIMWYFREDVMVNAHHWYWHMSFPLMNNEILRDRRGELFYFMHRSMTARYNIERLCLGLEFTTALDLYPGAHVPEGYNTHLNDMNTGKSWTDRPDYQQVSDIMHQNNPATRQVIFVANLVEIERRLRQTIHTGYFITPKGKMRIPPDPLGIDLFGNSLESTDYSINPEYYDMTGFHNSGHRIIGYSVDPNFEHMLPPGVMADAATAMRDPIFYRWHTTINHVFDDYKSTLKPYQPHGGEWPLHWEGVKVTGVNVIGDHGSGNHLKTFWNKRKFDLALGLAFNRNNTEDDELPDYLKVCATHMDHEEFSYQISLERLPCAKSHSNTATVRIFIAPRYNLHGKRFTMNEQRLLFVHMDKFKVKLKVGKTIITRHSTESALTNSWAKTLATLRRELGSNPDPPNCGCGWPHHLLLPRGTQEGMPFDIFVMVTNGDEDAVFEKEANPFGSQCRPAPIYCGIYNRKYPDARPMGYPFDREPYKKPHGCEGWKGGHPILSKFCSIFSFDWRPPLFLEDYVHGISNMGTTEVVIQNVDH